MSKPIVLGIDLDGTLLKYSGFKGDDVFGAALPGAKAWVRGLYRAGVKMWVFTARATGPVRRLAVAHALFEAGFDAGMFEGITNIKRADFTWIVDDRAMPYTGPAGVHTVSAYTYHGYPRLGYLTSQEPWWRKS